MVGFTPASYLSVEYIQHWLGFLQKMLEASAPESAQKNINLEILRGLELMHPPRELVEQFTKIVQTTEDASERLFSSTEEAEKLSGSLASNFFHPPPGVNGKLRMNSDNVVLKPHLTALRLMNFKGIRGVEDEDGVLQPVQIELRPITLLFGPNSAGKSTILQALAYLREVLERRNLDPDRTLVGGEYMDLGGFRNLVHQHDLSRPMKLGFVLEGLEGDLPTYLTEDEEFTLEGYANGPMPADGYDRAESICVDFTIEWSEFISAPLVSRVDVAINGVDFVSVQSSEDGRDVRIGYLDLSHPLHTGVYGEFDADDDAEPTDTFQTIARDSLRDDLVKTDPEIDLEALFSENTDDSTKGLFRTVAANIPLGGQTDALPRPGRKLEFAHNVWKEEGPFDRVTAAWAFVESAVSGLLVGPIDCMAQILERLLYVGPIREVPDRNLVLSRSPTAGSWARGAGAWNQLLADDGTLAESVNKWLAAPSRLNAGYRVDLQRFRELPVDHPLSTALEAEEVLDEFDPSTLLQSLPINSRIVLREEATGLEVHPHDVGVGISQLLPVVVAALNHPSGIVAVEQPELHVHPALQVELGDLFAERIRDFTGIFLLETHSEHLVLRLLRRIRETTEQEVPPGKPELQPDDVAVQFVESRNGSTTIKRLRINSAGDFDDRWPGGFFEERDDELFF